MNRRDERSREAFTLIELLVVVGIIAVLLAILLPTLGRSRAMSRSVSCLNNLQQILTATQLYITNDETGRLPFANWNDSNGFDTPSTGGWLYTMPHNGQTSDDMKSGTLWRYLQNESVYHCPAHDAPYTGVAAGQSSVEPITSYIMNGAVCGYGIYPVSFRSMAFKDPSHQVLYFECDQTGAAVAGTGKSGNFWNDGSSKPNDNAIGMRHGSYASVGFFDSHVESYDLAHYKGDLSLSPGPLWCSPGSRNGH